MVKWAFASLGSVILITIISFGVVINHFSKPRQTDILGAYNETRYQLSSSVSGKLTNEVHDLIDKASKPLEVEVASPDPTSDQLRQTVALLEQRLAIQQQTISGLQSANKGTGAAGASKPANTYIPMGLGGTSSSTDWTVINTQEIEVDPTEFPGYLGANLIVELKVKDGNGMAYARLFNVTDNTPVYSSEVSTSSGDFTPVTSGSFVFATGKKKYRLQLKSLTGYQVDVQLTKVKISF